MDRNQPINLKQVEELRGRIFARVFQSIVGQVVDADAVTQGLKQTLPSGISYDVLFESVRHLAGTTLTRTQAVELAWRLAANLKLLRNQIPVLPWAGQVDDEWIAFQILRMERVRNDFGKLGYYVTSRALTGTLATMLVNNFWADSAIYVVALELGFTRAGGKYPMANAMQLVGLRFAGLVEASRSRGRPTFFHVRCPASMQKWNRDTVLKLRLRVGDAKCPMNFAHECHRCAIGYERCIGSTHLRTYVSQDCLVCGEFAQAFDPEDYRGICINCSRKQRTKRKN